MVESKSPTALAANIVFLDTYWDNYIKKNPISDRDKIIMDYLFEEKIAN